MNSINLPAIDRNSFIQSAIETGHIGAYLSADMCPIKDWLIVKNFRIRPLQVISEEEYVLLYADGLHPIDRLINVTRIFKSDVREHFEYGVTSFLLPYRADGYTRDELALLQLQYLKAHPDMTPAIQSGLHRVFEPYRRKTMVVGKGGLSGLWEATRKKES